MKVRNEYGDLKLDNHLQEGRKRQIGIVIKDGE